ncbi:hypothetical protein JCM30471_07400 [Desulfuromonas carbonis]|uniref:VanZ family protein n=1 Tax=Desulfuromonas sp. DDH964 TaxID=1823759 RepID=UPI00078D1304|nr:VanZ family protein [Desulfuromonas sp. DDH964]AMV72256.1 hypothetical protein DBW_1903 [Desulfuromonas sp. DDH964]
MPEISGIVGTGFTFFLENNFLPRKSTLFWISGCLTWAGLVLWLSLTPHPPRLNSTLLSWDKFQHCIAYLLLTLLAGNSALRLWPRQRYAWLLAGAAALLFGAMIEGLQFLGGRGRVADFHDLLANAVGIIIACLAASAWQIISRDPRNKI